MTIGLFIGAGTLAVVVLVGWTMTGPPPPSPPWGTGSQ